MPLICTVTSPPKDLTHPKLATTNTDKKPIGSTPRGSGVDFLELPLKYKRKPIDQVEIDYIMVRPQSTQSVLNKYIKL